MGGVKPSLELVSLLASVVVLELQFVESELEIVGA